MSTPLTTSELEAAMAALPGWSIEEGKLIKEYQFESFARAMSWMMNAAIEIDKHDHHPEWINLHDRVLVALTTHDANNQVSAKDIAVAKMLDALRQ